MTERALARTLVLACRSVTRGFQRQQSFVQRTYASIGPSQASNLSWREYLALRSSKRKWQVVGTGHFSECKKWTQLFV